jgi:HEAT repeat protein/MFS-type transporter involved in bile tolerance (Atg22 family)
VPPETPTSEQITEPVTPQADNGLSRLEIRRALRDWSFEGCVATVQGTLTSGAFQTGFALYLGCSSFVIGVLAAIPAFAGLLQLVSSYFAQRYGRRRYLVSGFSLASRLLWIPILLIPFVLPRNCWVGTFLILSLLSSALINVSNPLWMAWISDLVPADNRGRYFGLKNMYGGVVGMVAAILGGAFLDAATKRHLYSDKMAFAIIFGVSCLFAFPSLPIALRSPDPGERSKPRTDEAAPASSSVWAYYAAPFADRGFRHLMVFLAGVVVSQTIAAQFFTVYQLQYLKLDYTALQLLGAVASIASLAFMPLLGYLADKYGNRPILSLSLVLVILPPLMWILASPDRLSFAILDIIALNLISGVGWAGVGLTQFNMMIGAAPAEQRTVYVSAVAAMSGLAGGVAPLLGGAIVTAFSHVHFSPVGPMRNGYHILFLLTALLRAASLLLLRPVEESGSSSARYVLEQLKATKPIGSVAGIQKLSRGGSAQVRQAAAEELGKLKTPVAVEELVKALDDVALPVREQAALALGEIGDARALTPLMRKLSDPAAGIEGPAAQALGKIGDRAALPALAAAAQLGPLTRRLAAVEALGRLPDARVTDVLLALLGEPTLRTPVLRALAEREDPDSAPALVTLLAEEREAPSLAILADALGRLGDPFAAPVLVAALDRTTSPTVRRELLNAVGSVVGGRDSFYPFLALESYARDETVGKILLNIQRRFRARAARADQSHSARVVVRAKQALEAYVRGDLTRSLRRLCQIGELVNGGAEDTRRLSAFQTLCGLADRAARQASVSPEEALLAVFLVRLLTDR